MKKVFGFIGSPLKEKSNTFTVTKMMTNQLEKMHHENEEKEELDIELLTAGHVKINYCKGCWSCLTKGWCPQDKTDDMTELKEKMLNADFIIFGTPVYTMQVSGQMKTFLDRLCAWYHLIRLAGKPGLTVVTTASGGLEDVHTFLEMLMGALGVKTIDRLNTLAYFPQAFKDREEAQLKAHKTAEIIYPYVMGEKQIESDPEMEECFNAMRHKVIFGKEWLPADYKYWEANKMLQIESYQELIDKIRAKKNKDKTG